MILERLPWQGDFVALRAVVIAVGSGAAPRVVQAFEGLDTVCIAFACLRTVFLHVSQETRNVIVRAIVLDELDNCVTIRLVDCARSICCSKNSGARPLTLRVQVVGFASALVKSGYLGSFRMRSSRNLLCWPPFGWKKYKLQGTSADSGLERRVVKPYSDDLVVPQRIVVSLRATPQTHGHDVAGREVFALLLVC
jgi:hypothetical protein